MQPRTLSHNYDLEIARRIIVETLRKTKEGRTTNIHEIAQSSRATSGAAIELLSALLKAVDPSRISLGRADRAALVSEATRLDALHSVARVLSWQEFEEFAENCLDFRGFRVNKGVIFSDEKRRWQIDLVAVRGQILLSVDCKHWESSNPPSKFIGAIEHQRMSLLPLILHLRRSGFLDAEGIQALPMIITIFEPRKRLLDGVVFVSVGQLPDFLDHLSPYDTELPFRTDRHIVRSPIS